MTTQTIEAVVIGGSAGALEPLETILSALPPRFIPSIAVVLHVPPTTSNLLPDVLRPACALPVMEPEDKEPVAESTVYVAAPGYHMFIEKDRRFSFSVDELVHYSRPSVDLLFESAADAYGSALVGILLSGANEDGAAGLAAIKDAGGRSVVQAPGPSLARAMPEAALRHRAADHVLSPAEIGAWLAGLGAHLNEG